MKTDKLFDLRFLVPPTLSILFVFLFLLPHFIGVVKPDAISCVVKSVANINWAFGALGILGLGFLISSVTEAYVNFMKLRIPKYGEPELGYLKEVLGSWVDEKNNDSLELASWFVLNKAEKTGEAFLREQIHKRWYMAIANYYCFCGMALACVFSVDLYVVEFLINPISFTWPIVFWLLLCLLLSIFLMIIFCKNGQEARKSALDMFMKPRRLKSWTKSKPAAQKGCFFI